MLPIIAKVRASVPSYIAAQPVPYKTHTHAPTFESLQLENGERAFPLALEPFLCNRVEMANFARQAQALAVSYIDICCGGSHHYRRAMATALGPTVPARRHSPAMEPPPIL